MVQYKYTIAREPGEVTEEVQPRNYTWGISVSHCSASCATGEQYDQRVRKSPYGPPLKITMSLSIAIS